MGQYYKPISLDKKEWLYSHNFDAGLKLMEHSYIGNDLLDAVEILLIPEGRWHKTRIVWAGDYADKEDVDSEFFRLYKGEIDNNSPNLYQIMNEENGFNNLDPYTIHQFKEENKIDLKEFPFILNHTEKTYIDKRLIEKDHTWTDPREGIDYDIKIHPLPLLTAEGNGRGGGDFHEGGIGYEYIGQWARAIISIEKEVPEGYELFDISFKE